MIPRLSLLRKSRMLSSYILFPEAKFLVICVRVFNPRSCHPRLTLGRAPLCMHIAHNRDREKSSSQDTQFHIWTIWEQQPNLRWTWACCAVILRNSSLCFMSTLPAPSLFPLHYVCLYATVSTYMLQMLATPPPPPVLVCSGYPPIVLQDLIMMFTLRGWLFSLKVGFCSGQKSGLFAEN